ncbi:hypothetical protein [Paenibacillus durus]|uniref:hypothetical protein n=1 Tax=Paenibacillus durus TaxID=44251 RepID=UPI0014707C47|nr:hypothetical protein [Paenibacillus durus]
MLRDYVQATAGGFAASLTLARTVRDSAAGVPSTACGQRWRLRRIAYACANTCVILRRGGPATACGQRWRLAASLTLARARAPSAAGVPSTSCGQRWRLRRFAYARASTCTFSGGSPLPLPAGNAGGFAASLTHLLWSLSLP